MAQIPYKIYLDESELPQAWYNLRADMKNKPAPLLNPATHQPMTFEELRPVFCDELVKQELDDTTPVSYTHLIKVTGKVVRFGTISFLSARMSIRTAISVMGLWR